MMQPNSPIKEISALKDESTPLTKETPTVKEIAAKDNMMGTKEAAKIQGHKKDENFPIYLSSEDLKKVYERKKKFKQIEEEYHFQDAHHSEINSVVLTSDDKYLISGSDDRSIKVFDLKTKQQIHHFEDVHGEKITSLAISPNDKFLISGSLDKSIKIFNLETKQQIHHFENAHQDQVTSIAVTPDNKYIVSGSGDSSIKIFNMDTKQEVHHFQDAHEYWIGCVAVTPDGKYIISCSDDQSIKVFDLKTKQEVHHFRDAHSEVISSIVVTSDSRYVVSGSADKSLKVFDLKTKEEVGHIKNAHSEPIRALALTFDNRFVISAAWDFSIKVFDVKTRQEVHHFENVHTQDIASMVVTSDGKWIISCSWDRSIKVLPLEVERKVHHFENIHERQITSVVITPNSKYIISASDDGSIKMIDFHNKQEVYHFKDAHKNTISSIAVTSDSKYLISGSYDSSIKVFNIETKQEVRSFQDAHDERVTSITVTPDNRYIISASNDQSLKIFDLNTKQQIHHFRNVHEGWISSVAVSADNRYIISAAWDKSIQVFDLKTRQQIHHFQNADSSALSSVAITSDNRYVIVGSSNNSIKVFDLQTKQQVHHFENVHSGGVNSVTTTHDNRYVISGSSDKSIKVFDLKTKQQVHHFENAHSEAITSVAVTSDNKYIISGSEDKSIKAFEFQTAQKIEVDVPQNPHQTVTAENRFHEKSKVFDLQTKQHELIYGDFKRFSIFNTVDCFLFDKSVEYSVSEAVKHPELFVLPFGWNILHIVSVFGNHEFITKMPDFSRFKMPFLLDAFGYTPFHYIIAHKNMSFISANIIFSYVCDYLKDCQLKSPCEFQDIIESLTPLLSFILEKIEIKTKLKFLRIVYTKSPVPHNNAAPIFGNILSEAAAFSDFPVLTQETRDKIWNYEGTTQVEFRSNFLNLDYDILSQDMSNMIDCLKNQEGQDIFKTTSILRLIDYIWSQAETSLMLFFAFYSAFVIALSVYLTLEDYSLPYEIALLAVSILLTVNELWQAFNLRRSYLVNLWNWLDLSHLLLTISFLATRIAENDNELARAWMSSIIVILGYIRWISLLKIFKPTRNLIQVVITIIRDMASFIIVIALIIIAFSLIFLVFNREAGYGDYLYEAYNILYGPADIEEDAAWPFSQKLLMAVLAFFLNVVLLNLLISIMGDSYGQVLEMRDRTDALTRLEMISEAVIYKKLFKLNHQTKRGYLIYCQAVALEEDENSQEEKLQAISQAIKKLETQNEDSKQEFQTLKNRISSLETGIISCLQREFSQFKLENKH